MRFPQQQLLFAVEFEHGQQCRPDSQATHCCPSRRHQQCHVVPSPIIHEGKLPIWRLELQRTLSVEAVPATQPDESCNHLA